MPIDPAKLGMPILAQSADDLVVVKPAGMATDLTRDPRRESLISRIRASVPEELRGEPRLVHRLDRVTRGIVMVTLSRQAAAFYGEQIREGLWEKYYVARIPAPRPERFPHHKELHGKHKAYIKEGETRATLVRSGGKPSFMEILTIGPAPNHPNQAHVLIRLLTGRLHQIRVMMAGLDLPLIGDELYGGGSPAATGPIYLEHIALFYVDYTTRDVTLAYNAADTEREPVSPEVLRRLTAITRARVL